MKRLVWFKHNWMAALDIIKVLMIGSLLIIAINGLGRAVNQTQQIKALTIQDKQLSQDNKRLGSQNRILNGQNQSLIKCIANTFATYTQTLRPVHFEALDQCATSLGPLGIGYKPVASSGVALQQLSKVEASQPQSAPAQTKAQAGTTSQPPPVLKQVTTTPNDILKLIGL